jgi:hypothetical protein
MHFKKWKTSGKWMSVILLWQENIYCPEYEVEINSPPRKDNNFGSKDHMEKQHIKTDLS